MSNKDEEEARHLLHQQYERPEQQSDVTDQNDITAAVAGICFRLDTLASINAANILIPGRPQERYHAIIEDAYAALAQGTE